MLKSYLKNSKLEVMPKITVGENLELNQLYYLFYIKLFIFVNIQSIKEVYFNF